MMIGETYFIDRDIAEREIRELAEARRKLEFELSDVNERLRRVARHLAVQHGYSGRTIGQLVGVSNMTISRWLR